jgi:exodeoxyribonuclease VII large subunit
VGNLYEQFLRLKEQLEREGLLASAGKRALPAYPRRIGIVTSLQAAALRDVLSTLTRRAPHLDIILYPTPVQGEGAAAQIAAAVRQASQRAECDVLILCRGGGSIEDLWAFNDEALARTVRACSIPVITGIGHETDFTIADFVADQRAPTPTAAAELATPERSALLARLSEVRQLLRRQIGRGIEQRQQRLDGLAQRLQHPAQALAQQRERLLNLQRRLDNSLRESSTQGRNALARLTRRLILARPDTGRYARRLDALAPKLHGGWEKCIDARAGALARIAASLTHLNPDGVLARGYSIVTDSEGNILRSSHSLEPNDRIAVCFHTGRVEAEVTSVSQ